MRASPGLSKSPYKRVVEDKRFIPDVVPTLYTFNVDSVQFTPPQKQSPQHTRRHDNHTYSSPFYQSPIADQIDEVYDEETMSPQKLSDMFTAMNEHDCRIADQQNSANIQVSSVMEGLGKKMNANTGTNLPREEAVYNELTDMDKLIQRTEKKGEYYDSLLLRWKKISMMKSNSIPTRGSPAQLIHESKQFITLCNRYFNNEKQTCNNSVIVSGKDRRVIHLYPLKILKLAEQVSLECLNQYPHLFIGLYHTTCNNISFFYRSVLSDYKNALHYAQRVVDWSENNSFSVDASILADAHVTIGAVLSRMKKHKHALSYHLTALQLLSTVCKEIEENELLKGKQSSAKSTTIDDTTYILSPKDLDSFQLLSESTNESAEVAEPVNNNKPSPQIGDNKIYVDINDNIYYYGSYPDSKDTNILKSGELDTHHCSLVITYHNIAIEYEYLQNYREAKQYHVLAVENSVKFLGLRHQVTTRVSTSADLFLRDHFPSERSSILSKLKLNT